MKMEVTLSWERELWADHRDIREPVRWMVPISSQSAYSVPSVFHSHIMGHVLNH